jgi:hypothetical protein
MPEMTFVVPSVTAKLAPDPLPVFARVIVGTPV